MNSGLEGLKGLLFDKDGTLFDFHASWGGWLTGFVTTLSEGDIRVERALLDALDYNPSTGQFGAQSVFVHSTLEEILDKMLPHLPQWNRDHLHRYSQEKAAELIPVPVAPLPPLLNRFKQAGLRLGVATNDNHQPTMAHLDRAGITRYFDFIAGYDSGYGGKPETGMQMAFCQQTGLPPATVAMVGDSAHDLVSGRKAGMITIAVLTGPANRSELAPLADVTLNSITEITALLAAKGVSL